MIPTPPAPAFERRRKAAALGAAALLIQACGAGLYVRPQLAAGCAACLAATEDLDARLVLIGDTGEYKPQHPNYALLAREARRNPNRTLILFLGDNVYPRGMPADTEAELEDRLASEVVLQQQIDAVRFTGARAVLLPGNHDWDRSGARGQERVLAQQEFIERHAYPGDIRLRPRDACPGPVTVDIGIRVRVVLTDSQWLLTPPAQRRGTRCEWGPEGAGQIYDPADNADVYAKLREIIASSTDKDLVFATHHPLRTRGPHGGYVSLKHWIFPLTGFRSWLWLPVPLLYPALRYGVKRSDQDLVGTQNSLMVEALLEVYTSTSKQPLIAAAGHEHALQVFEEPGTALYHLVSGGGVKHEPTGRTDRSLFKHAAVGLMVLDYFTDGRVGLRVLEPRGVGEAEEVSSMWLAESR